MEIAERQKWEPLVGHLILTCGEIELRLLQLYWNLTLNRPCKNTKLKEMGLRDKIQEIRGFLNETNLPSTLKEKGNKLLDRTSNLADKRNLVAHNPLYLDVYFDSEGTFKPGPNIRSLRNPKKSISYVELGKAVEFADKLSKDLFSLVIEVGSISLS